MLENVEWVRKRQLAGDARAGRWARAKARRLQHEYVRRHWRLLIGSAAAVLVPGSLALLLFPSGFPRGFIAGVLVAAVVGLMMFAIVQITGTGGTMMGVLAEQWTASELRKLHRQGWRVVNGAGLRPWDIDHVLIGPGGVFAIETKWSSYSWELSPPGPYVLAAITQAQKNAADLQRWQPFRSGGAGTVQPIVMLWGPELAETPEMARVQDIGETAVVVGAFAEMWRAGLCDDRLTSDQVENLWKALDGQLRRRDPADALKTPMPPSLASMGARAAMAAAACIAGCLSALYLIRATHSNLWWPVGVVGPTLFGVSLHRIRAVRYITVAWLMGIGFAVSMIVMLLADHLASR